MTSERPWLSVVTPSYQTCTYIRECLDSVAALGDGVEHIVVDGKSDDGSHEVLGSWADGRPDRLWIRDRDRGQTHAVNMGLARASAPVALWINSDDYVVASRESLRRDVAALLGSPSRLASAPMLLVDERSGRTEHRRPKNWPTWTFVAFGVSTVFTPSVLFRTGDDARLDETYDDAADYDLWARLALHGGILRLRDPIGAFRLRAGSKTVDDVGTQLTESRRIRARLIPRLGPGERILARAFAPMADLRVRSYVRGGGLSA